jgi:hypothetical protein
VIEFLKRNHPLFLIMLMGCVFIFGFALGYNCKDNHYTKGYEDGGKYCLQRVIMHLEDVDSTRAKFIVDSLWQKKGE